MQVTINLIIFFVMILGFFVRKIPAPFVSLAGALALLFTGCVSISDIFSVIVSPTVLTLIFMFVVVSGVQQTQIIKKIVNVVCRISNKSFTKILAGYVFATFILGQFIPSTTALFIIIYPMVLQTCEAANINPAKMFYSIGLVAVMTSYTFLPIGPYAASFIEDNGYLMEYGITNFAFNSFSEMYVKIFVSICILIWAIFLAPKLVKGKIDLSNLNEKNYNFVKSGFEGNVENSLTEKSMQATEIDKITVDNKEPKRKLKKYQEVVGIVVFSVVIVSFMFSSFGLEVWIIPALGTCVLIFTRVLTQKTAIKAMRIDVVLLYIGVAILGRAFLSTGAGILIGNKIIKLFNNVNNGYLLGFVFFLAAFVLNLFMYSRGISKILLPIVISTALALQVDPRGLMIVTYLGAMSSLLTPMSTPIVPMLMKFGNYEQKDLLKMGWIPALISCVVSVFVAMTLYPC